MDKPVRDEPHLYRQKLWDRKENKIEGGAEFTSTDGGNLFSLWMGWKNLIFCEIFTCSGLISYINDLFWSYFLCELDLFWSVPVWILPFLELFAVSFVVCSFRTCWYLCCKPPDDVWLWFWVLVGLWTRLPSLPALISLSPILNMQAGLLCSSFFKLWLLHPAGPVRPRWEKDLDILTLRGLISEIFQGCVHSKTAFFTFFLFQTWVDDFAVCPPLLF